VSLAWPDATLVFRKGEGDYVVNRVFRNSPPLRVTGGVAYARYQFTPHFAMAGRFEYL
jgi:hypothetical protein